MSRVSITGLQSKDDEGKAMIISHPTNRRQETELETLLQLPSPPFPIQTIPCTGVALRFWVAFTRVAEDSRAFRCGVHEI